MRRRQDLAGTPGHFQSDRHTNIDITDKEDHGITLQNPKMSFLISQSINAGRGEVLHADDVSIGCRRGDDAKHITVIVVCGTKVQAVCRRIIGYPISIITFKWGRIFTSIVVGRVCSTYVILQDLVKVCITCDTIVITCNLSV